MNVIEEYKGLSVDEIKAELAKTVLPVGLFMTQIEKDFNISTLIRNANAFGAKEVFYFGHKRFDRRGAVGTYNYTDVKYLETIDQVISLKEKYYFVAVDIIPGVSKPMEEYIWRPNTLMFFGEEQEGLPTWILQMCNDIVHITQRGSVPSLNVGTASGIALYDYSIKYQEPIKGNLHAV